MNKNNYLIRLNFAERSRTSIVLNFCFISVNNIYNKLNCQYISMYYACLKKFWTLNNFFHITFMFTAHIVLRISSSVFGKLKKIQLIDCLIVKNRFENLNLTGFKYKHLQTTQALLNFGFDNMIFLQPRCPYNLLLNHRHLKS